MIATGTVCSTPWPTGVGTMPLATPAGSSPNFSTSSGMPPGQVDEARRNLRSFEHLALDLFPAERVDQPLHAGAQLVLAVAVVVEDPEAGLDGGQQLLAGRELLEGERRVRVGAEAAGDEHAEAGLDGAVLAASGWSR